MTFVEKTFSAKINVHLWINLEVGDVFVVMKNKQSIHDSLNLQDKSNNSINLIVSIEILPGGSTHFFYKMIVLETSSSDGVCYSRFRDFYYSDTRKIINGDYDYSYTIYRKLPYDDLIKIRL